jgi:outer membrane protein TolC
MDRLKQSLSLLLAALMVVPTGCRLDRQSALDACVPAGIYETVASEIDYPAESECTRAGEDESTASLPPRTLSTSEAPTYQDISLEEVIRTALDNSQVLQDLGGAVVRSPSTTRTIWDPAIIEADPRYGTEAALSEFDGQFSTSVFWEKNHRALNNEFFGGGTRELYQDAGVFQAAITKRAATGSQFTIRHNVDYDANNAPGNFFPSAWNVNLEAEYRQPILQGSGTQFNRIAGPDQPPGVYNGVLIARLNSDVALTDFEVAVRDLVSNLENAYWDLYYGYRVLDARVEARDAALDTWRKVHALFEEGRVGGEADKEAQAREQYFRFQQEVLNALSGEAYESTRNWNGLPSGAFRTTQGVLLAERRLRLLMGLSASDGRLLRPTDEPVLAKVGFDWGQVVQEATTRRVELRRQKWQIRRRELELIASKNHLLPQLDAVGRYRWRGFGNDLIDSSGGTLPRFDNAYGDLTTGDFQEWQLGLELSVPIGFRRAHAGVRDAELLLARERAILRDQQREVVHEAADAIAELDRAYVVVQNAYNHVLAGQDQLQSVEAAYDAGKITFDVLLDAQRRLAEAKIEYVRNRTQYAVAAKNVHFVKGTLLEFDGVYLAEGPWPGQAYCDAADRAASRSPEVPLNYASARAPAVSRGVFPQTRDDSAIIDPQLQMMPQVLPQTVPPEELPLRYPDSQASPAVPNAASVMPRATGGSAGKTADPAVVTDFVTPAGYYFTDSGNDQATLPAAAKSIQRLPPTGDD